MAELTNREYEQLTRNGECFLHTHPRHVIDSDDVYNAQAARIIKVISANYTLLPNDEIIMVDTSSGNITITLPHSDFQKEYQVVKTADAFTLIIVPTAPDTILGETGVSVTAKLTSLNFKMDTVRGDWFLI